MPLTASGNGFLACAKWERHLNNAGKRLHNDCMVDDASGVLIQGYHVEPKRSKTAALLGCVVPKAYKHNIKDLLTNSASSSFLMRQEMSIIAQAPFAAASLMYLPTHNCKVALDQNGRHAIELRKEEVKPAR